MSREAHEKAAQYHEYAAKAHRRAADYLATSDQLAARDQARNAFDYSRFAYELSARAKAAIEDKLNQIKSDVRLSDYTQAEERLGEKEKAVSASW